MRAGLLALAIVMLPLVALSTLQVGIPVLAPAMIADIGLAPEAVGLLSGCIGFGSVWMFAANTRITPVLGPLTALVAACALATLGVTLVLTGWLVLVFPGAVLIGFAYAVTAPAGSQILSRHAPQQLWGTLFSIRQAGVPLGGALAGIVGTSVAAAFGWRTGLACLALALLAAATLLISVPRAYREGANGARFRLRGLFAPGLITTPFRTLRDMPQLRILTLASLGFAAVHGSISSFMTTYLTDGVGLELQFAGTLFATMQVSAFAGRLGAGVLADRIGAFRPVLIGMSIAAAIAGVVLGNLDPAWPHAVLFVIAALTGLAASTWNGLFLAEIARIVPPDDIGQATAGTTFFTFIGYMLVPPAFALIVRLAGYQVAYYAIATAALFALVCLLRMRGN